MLKTKDLILFSCISPIPRRTGRCTHRSVAEYDRFDGNPNNAVTQRVAQLRSLGLVPESDDASISAELASTDPSLMAVYAAQMTEADQCRFKSGTR